MSSRCSGKSMATLLRHVGRFRKVKRTMFAPVRSIVIREELFFLLRRKEVRIPLSHDISVHSRSAPRAPSPKDLFPSHAGCADRGEEAARRLSLREKTAGRCIIRSGVEILPIAPGKLACSSQTLDSDPLTHFSYSPNKLFKALTISKQTPSDSSTSSSQALLTF